MPLIYITGVAGSGKSTIQHALQRLGYEAHDADDRDIGAPHNNQTERIVEMPPAAERTPEWFSQHSWNMLGAALEQLKECSRGMPIFVCGAATNELAMLHYFDKIIGLDISEATLRQRIATREDNDFGKADHELQMILDRFRKIKEKYSAADIVWLDAEQPVNNVANDIIGLVTISKQ